MPGEFVDVDAETAARYTPQDPKPPRVTQDGLEIFIRKGDWHCGGCGNHIFASKKVCYMCGTEKRFGRVFENVEVESNSVLKKAVTDHGPSESSAEMEKDWRCVECGSTCFGSTRSCFRCGSGRPHPDDPDRFLANCEPEIEIYEEARSSKLFFET